MPTFEVSLNGKKLCTAGVGDDGVLTVIVMSQIRGISQRAKEDLRLDVGGLIGSTREYLDWQKQRKLRLGDEIKIKIAEAEVASKPRRREREDPTFGAKAEARYLENAARRLGWKIFRPGSRSTRRPAPGPPGRTPPPGPA